MGKPRTSATVLELRGAFKKNPQRRRYQTLRTSPLSPDPDPSWSPALQDAWRCIVDSAPDGILRTSDFYAVRTAAQLSVLLDKHDIDDPMFDRLDRAMWRYRKHLGLTPLARTRFTR